MALFAVAAGIAAAMGPHVGRSSAPAHVCGLYSVRAEVRAKAVCLSDAERCGVGLARQYARYGFECASGSLLATWKRLDRPLHIPTLPPGATCPISSIASRIDFRAHNVGAGIGPGPVFPAPFSPDAPQPLNAFSVPAGWHGGKHALFTLSAYHGRVLIRGRQLDGPGIVTFASNEIRGAPALSSPKPELRLGVGGPQVVHTFFFLTPPGCYAYQIDGTTFSYLVVFTVSQTG